MPPHLLPGSPDPICKAAIDLVKHFEGLSLDAYLCLAGIPTIGYGHTAGVTLGQSITAERAEALLSRDLAAAAAVVDRVVTVPVSGGQREDRLPATRSPVSAPSPDPWRDPAGSSPTTGSSAGRRAACAAPCFAAGARCHRA